jgi:hypothetical protein
VIRFTTIIFLGLLAAAALARSEDATQTKSKAPIINFSLPTFTNPDGFRSMLVRGSEAWLTGPGIIDVKELSLTVFSGDATNRIDTMMLSPSARLLPEEKTVSGDSTLRVIDLQKEFEATGTGWRYTNKDKTVTLHKNVRVVLRAEVKNILK